MRKILLRAGLLGYLSWGWVTFAAVSDDKAQGEVQGDVQGDVQVKIQEKSGEEAKGSKHPRKTVKKGKILREKEAEGTEAPNRFENDTIIKSHYEYNGQPLEVDTD